MNLCGQDVPAVVKESARLGDAEEQFAFRAKARRTELVTLKFPLLSRDLIERFRLSVTDTPQNIPLVRPLKDAPRFHDPPHASNRPINSHVPPLPFRQSPRQFASPLSDH